MSIVLLVIGLLLFVGLVVIHEFGHFIAARRNGVEVEEFGIGFPPRAWSRKIHDKKGGFLFSLNWLPIGGFVKLKGESDAAKEPGSLGVASTWSKTKIMLAGVIMNLVVAFGLFTILGWIGMPQLVEDQFTVKSDTKVVNNDVLVGYVEKNSPAEIAGLEARDELLAIGPAGRMEQVYSANDLPKLTEKFAGKNVIVQYDRKGEGKRETSLTLRSKEQVEASKKTEHPQGYLGILPSDYAMTRSTWSAPIVAAGLIGQFSGLTFQGLGNAVAAIFQGDGSKAAENVSGPVGIFVLLKQGSLIGFQLILFLIALISLTLTLMNVLPIPALDGGRLYMVLLSRLSQRLGGKAMSQEMEERIVGASFLFLLFLIVLITIVDVKRFF
ncbi:MAG TPA: M50 family metallopeptidase [Candidatus Saccharimonadales bacterium]|nr:M50 family metallopeptidase [Candidatus Saccharimonadales bacterium]